MKRCPHCGRTYSVESFSFCLDDGALLSASYDPDATLVFQRGPDDQLDATIIEARAVNRRTHQSDSGAQQQACRVVVVSREGRILYSTPTRHSRRDLRSKIISFQRRWLQKKHPKLKTMNDVEYRLQWMQGDKWEFD